jgi:hypothetical protein
VYQATGASPVTVNNISSTVAFNVVTPTTTTSYKLISVTDESTNASSDFSGINASITIPLRIGDSYQGGKIFYIDGTGQHGLIAATVDQSTGIKWSLLSNPPFPITGATATAIGTGLANTNTIIYSQGGTPTSYAAGLARAYGGGGFDDWYLPSKDELNQLYLNKAVVGGLNVYAYWSSSENGSFPAWLQVFNDGRTPADEGRQISNGKDYPLGVRAIRAF